MNGRVYVAGHRGLVGSALVRRLERDSDCELVTRTRAELDLRDARAVDAFFATERPDFIFLAAAKVGGIQANASYPVQFLDENLRIQLNVLDAAHRHGATKLLLLGSSCIYPRLAPQPMREDALLTGPLEPTNEAYAIAKIAGVKLCQAYQRQYGARFISAMPTNLYGPGDNFDTESSHVLPALIRKCHDAAVAGADSLTLWGTGTPRREFLHADDLADACVLLMQTYEDDAPINVGTGSDLTIRELALLVADVVGFTGRLEFDASRPDGPPRKLLDIARLTALGWEPRISLREGIAGTYEWFRNTAPAVALGRRA